MVYNKDNSEKRWRTSYITDRFMYKENDNPSYLNGNIIKDSII